VSGSSEVHVPGSAFRVDSAIVGTRLRPALTAETPNAEPQKTANVKLTPLTPPTRAGFFAPVGRLLC